ncbi:PaaI family thioesterase [uncultured Slackia sp.]|uniref:PaaI family thioesterase n=1 Tax=uncultured Slackia sp. TaxID=665903 RepID=UPI0026E0B590|nr:PaaI family thioesterase [uncultured Slackia sp.]
MMFFERIGGRFVEKEKGRVVMVTPVVEEMLQPQGILHGGMSAYLAESVASEAANLALEGAADYIVGLDLTSTHLLPVALGDTIRSVATSVRQGGRIQVWKIEQYRESDGELFNVSQLTTYAKRAK